MSEGDKLDKLTDTVGQLAEQFTVFGTKLDGVDAKVDRIDKALDVVAIQVARTQACLEKHRSETAQHFERVDRRLGKIETRLETVEMQTR